MPPQPSPGPGPGSIFPDPHLTTFDGLHYDFQTVGEFVLVKDADGGSFQVQARLAAPASGTTYSVISQIAIAVGDDWITIDPTRANPVWVNGTPVTITGVLGLAAGVIIATPQGYQVNLDTGESITANFAPGGMTTGTTTTSFGISATVSLGTGHSFGDVEGLLGNYNGDPTKDLTLADGTVLPTSLPSSELYGEYADAWRLTQDGSHLDYGPGQTTATFTDTFYPLVPISIASFPTQAVAAATALAVASGITDPGLQQAAIYDYLITGNPATVTVEANLGQQGVTTTAAVTVMSPPPPPVLVIQPAALSETEAGAGATAAEFVIYRSGDTTGAVTVTYDVVAPNSSFIGAGAFGGTLPSGTITIAAGATADTLTLNILTGFDDTPTKTLAVDIASAGPAVVAGPSAQMTLIANTPVAGPAALFGVELVNDLRLAPETAGAVTTFALGAFKQALGANPATLSLAVLNQATLGSDYLAGFVSLVADSALPAGIVDTYASIHPGAVFDIANIGIDTTKVGAHSETLLVTPYDTNISGYAQILATQTIVVTDTVVALAQGTLSTGTIDLGVVRAGAMQTIAVTNTGLAGSENLDAAIGTLTGDGIGAGTVSALGVGLSSGALSVGLGAIGGGVVTGTVQIALASDGAGVDGLGATPLLSPHVIVSGTVYLEAQPQVGSGGPIYAHVGDAGSIDLRIGDASGYVESLIGDVIGTTGNITVPLGGIGTLAAGQTAGLSLTFATDTAGTLDGALLLAVQTDGAGTDGAPITALGTQTFDVLGQVDNYATAAIEEISGAARLSGGGTAYTIDFGTVAQGSTPNAATLGIENAAAGIADLLAGSFTGLGDGAGFTLGGFAGFSAVAAGHAAIGPSITIATGAAGTFAQTITLDPLGTNAGGYAGALPDETITLVGTVAAVPCYCRGTRIATAEGETAVENLRIGDFVCTASGALRPIRWIGTRSYDGRFAARNPDVLPIVIRAGALADGVPARDLAVSPKHALYLDGVLVPAELLVNGRSIRRRVRVRTVAYFHIELDSHDILLAEGAPAESFVDCDSRLMFFNARDYDALYPDDMRPRHAFCAERVEDGALLAALRTRLAARAGLAADHVEDAAAIGTPDGRLDVAEHGELRGWAFDVTRPHTAVTLECVVDGILHETFVANRFRDDLRKAGFGDGRCAYVHRFAVPLDPAVPHRLVVRRRDDGSVIAALILPALPLARFGS